MKHEYECEIAMSGVGVTECICGYIQHAYRRGREDAAEAVEALGNLRCYEVYEADDGYLAGSYYEVDAIAAARGDGEQ